MKTAFLPFQWQSPPVASPTAVAGAVTTNLVACHAVLAGPLILSLTQFSPEGSVLLSGSFPA
jgi:hypothetical protein